MNINMTLMITVVAETLYPIDPSIVGFLFVCGLSICSFVCF